MNTLLLFWQVCAFAALACEKLYYIGKEQNRAIWDIRLTAKIL